MEDSSKSTLLFDSLYPKIEKSLSQSGNLVKLREFYGEVIGRNNEALSDSIPCKAIYVDKRIEDKYYNALQLKYANAITCHKSQGGQWRCVFIDNPFWQEELTVDDLKWLYTAITRATEKVYLVNFKDELFSL